ALGRRLPHKGGDGALQELTLTTNGSQLARFAEELYAAGMRRINVSMDSLDPDRFKTLTRRGDLAQVQDGIGAALAAGLSVKVNAVALRGINDDEIDDLMAWCGERGCDLTFIETMPMGQIEGGRADPYLPLTEVRAQLQRHWTLTESDHVTGGPARYWDCAQTGRRVGFITPLTHNFCESCNRVRLTCTGMLYMCLGQEDRKDLRAVMRDPALRTADDRYQALTEALDEAVSRKPKGHDFVIDRANDGPAVPRHMSVTGG
ncbi:MAG: GTP 3',8-cyclase MoaA, partial [Rhodospirillaceae bacterium]